METEAQHCGKISKAVKREADKVSERHARHPRAQPHATVRGRLEPPFAWIKTTLHIPFASLRKIDRLIDSQLMLVSNKRSRLFYKVLRHTGSSGIIASIVQKQIM